MRKNRVFFGIIGVSCLAVANLTMTWADESNSEPAPNEPMASADQTNDETTDLSKEQVELVNQVFSSRLLEIAAEYKQYERVDQTMRWSPLRCTLPLTPLNSQEAALSASESEETHGKKLYFLYARKPGDYWMNVWGLTDQGGGKEKDAIRAPLGQTLVKEAWNPVKRDIGKHQDRDEDAEDLRPFAKDGEAIYHAGAKQGLYIMFKTGEDTPGTDRGWVYGTVSADGKSVTSVGLVKSCIQCHQEAPIDRQIGLSVPPKLKERVR